MPTLIVNLSDHSGDDDKSSSCQIETKCWFTRLVKVTQLLGFSCDQSVEYKYSFLPTVLATSSWQKSAIATMSDSSVAETTSKASQEFQPLATREDDEDIEDEEGEEVDGQQGEGQASSEDKQKKKKKKSKAAAKLRKKLGMASKEDDAAVTTFATNGQTNEAETSSGPLLTDEEVNQLQQAILKEQGPIAANKADRATLEKLMKMMNLEKANLIKDQNAKQKQHKAIADHKFWKTQPVSRPGGSCDRVHMCSV